GQPAVNGALELYVRESPARSHESPIRAEDCRVRSRDLNNRVRVRVLAIRRNRIRLAARVWRRRVRRCVPSHIGERRTLISRTDKRAAIRREPVATVGVGTAQIDYIGLARW